jgi:hypothetical protein
MSHRKYHFTREAFEQQTTLSEGKKDSLEKTHLLRLLANEPKISSIFRRASLATSDADHVPLRFPLIIHSGHVEAQWAYNERLASMGNIVLSVDAISAPYEELSVVKDLLFGIAYLKRATPLKFDKVIGVGSGYGGLNIFGLQMTTAILDGIISLDGSEHWNGKIEYFKDLFSQTYDIRKMNIPYLRFYAHDSTTADPTFAKSMKYASQHLIDITSDNFNHGTFQYPHAISKYHSAELVESSTEMLNLKLKLTTQFISYLNKEVTDPIPIEFTKDNRMSIDHSDPLKSPPNSGEIVTLMNRLGKNRLADLLIQNLKNDPDFIDYNLLFINGRNLTWEGEYATGIPFLELANSLFPKEVMGYLELLRTSFWMKDDALNGKYLEGIRKAVSQGHIELSTGAKDFIEKNTL